MEMKSYNKGDVVVVELAGKILPGSEVGELDEVLYSLLGDEQTKVIIDLGKSAWLSSSAIGILVQFSWEAVLAISGIRNLSWNTLVVNSLLETNMGLPYLYMIHRVVTRRWNEQLRSVEG